MRRICCFSVAGLVAIGLSTQAHAGLFDCFHKKDKAAEASCCAPTVQPCATSVCTTQPNCNAPCTTNACATKPGCTTGCTTAPAPAPKKGGLFSMFQKKEKPAAVGCAPQACATQPCATNVCEPTCATPAKPKSGGLFSRFASKEEKPAACATSCTTNACEPNCAYPSQPCATNPVCVTKPGACATTPVSVGKPVCGPQQGCTTNGCATTSCGTVGHYAYPVKSHGVHPAPKAGAPIHGAAPIPGGVVPNQGGLVAPQPEQVPAEGEKSSQPLPPSPPEPKQGAYYPSQIDNRQSARTDRLADLFGLPN